MLKSTDLNSTLSSNMFVSQNSDVCTNYTFIVAKLYILVVRHVSNVLSG